MSIRSTSNSRQSADGKFNEKQTGRDTVESVMAGDVVDENQYEIFKVTPDLVNFRTVGWQRAAMIFTKGAFYGSGFSVDRGWFVDGPRPDNIKKSNSLPG